MRRTAVGGGFIGADLFSTRMGRGVKTNLSQRSNHFDFIIMANAYKPKGPHGPSQGRLMDPDAFFGGIPASARI
jgi:hypothetical protein